MVLVSGLSPVAHRPPLGVCRRPMRRVNLRWGFRTSRRAIRCRAMTVDGPLSSQPNGPGLLRRLLLVRFRGLITSGRQIVSLVLKTLDHDACEVGIGQQASCRRKCRHLTTERQCIAAIRFIEIKFIIAAARGDENHGIASQLLWPYLRSVSFPWAAIISLALSM